MWSSFPSVNDPPQVVEHPVPTADDIDGLFTPLYQELENPTITSYSKGRLCELINNLKDRVLKKEKEVQELRRHANAQEAAVRSKIRILEESLSEAKRLEEHARTAANCCNDDAEQAMQALRDGQAIQKELHESLESAAQQLERLYSGMQEKNGFMLEGQDSVPSEGAKRGARAVVDMRALQMLKVISMRENRGQGLKLHLSFEVWHLKTQIDRLKKQLDEAWLAVPPCRSVQEEHFSPEMNVTGSADNSYASQPFHIPCVQRTEASEEQEKERHMISACVGLVQELMQLPHLDGGGRRSAAASLAGTSAPPSIHRRQSYRETHTILIDILNRYETRFREERGIGSDGDADNDDDDDPLMDASSIMSASGDGAYLIHRLEGFCKSIVKWIEEMSALNRYLERSLSGCVCSKYD